MRPDYCPIGGEPCQSVCAEPCSVAKKATPHETLIAQLMDSRVPKTEREHAAAREIERLRGAAPEPAAWINFNAATGERTVSFECESELASIPLYRAAPTPRKPLTRKELWAILASEQAYDKSGLDVFYRDQVIHLIRKAEAAHGIKEQEHE